MMSCPPSKGPYIPLIETISKVQMPRILTAQPPPFPDIRLIYPRKVRLRCGFGAETFVVGFLVLALQKLASHILQLNM